MTITEMLKEYHKTSRLATGVDISTADDKLLYMRWDLIEEEFSELDEVMWSLCSKGPMEDALKEMADLVYVIVGWCVTFGYDFDEVFKRVHENNMGRMYQPDGTIKYRDDGKVMKNKDYPPINLKDLM